MKNKKDNGWYWLLFAIAILVPSWYYSYYKISANSKYAIATTTKSYIAKGIRKQTDYEFDIEGQRFKGSFTELKNRAKEIKVPDGKYLVVYSVDDPETNILLIHKPVTKEINLDSLNRLGVDKEDIDWTKL